ncbi:nucleotide exchange factor GrpE [Porcipelethomonas sp.]|uniref:nucleotide exchange factor GrpE n=1 Tax=Porcipelethomonas sp. TaxID=2981675 RepID=UPI003EF4E2C9
MSDEEKNSRETEEQPVNKDMDIDIETGEEKSDESKEKIEELEAKLKDSDDKYLRLYAEYDNYRKRTAKEKIESYGDATSKCVADILPVLDSFERAIEAECADEAFKNGMQMIYNQFKEALKKIGVTEMEALGNEFDPNLHNAIKQVEDENFGENTVCEIFQKGYMLNDRVIRHAVVAVAN